MERKREGGGWEGRKRTALRIVYVLLNSVKLAALITENLLLTPKGSHPSHNTKCVQFIFLVPTFLTVPTGDSRQLLAVKSRGKQKQNTVTHFQDPAVQSAPSHSSTLPLQRGGMREHRAGTRLRQGHQSHPAEPTPDPVAPCLWTHCGVSVSTLTGAPLMVLLFAVHVASLLGHVCFTASGFLSRCPTINFSLLGLAKLHSYSFISHPLWGSSRELRPGHTLPSPADFPLKPGCEPP